MHVLVMRTVLRGMKRYIALTSLKRMRPANGYMGKVLLAMCIHHKQLSPAGSTQGLTNFAGRWPGTQTLRLNAAWAVVDELPRIPAVVVTES